MFKTPNGGILKTDVVTMQSGISRIKHGIYNIILNIDSFSKNTLNLLQELKNIDKICDEALFVTNDNEIEQIINNE